MTYSMWLIFGLLFGGLSESGLARSSKTFTSANLRQPVPCSLASQTASFEPEAFFSLGSTYMLLLANWLLEQNPPQLSTQLSSWGFGQVVLGNSGEDNYRTVVAEHELFILVVFQSSGGSGHFREEDAFRTEAADIVGSPGKIGLGFQKSFSPVLDQVGVTLRSFPLDNKPLFFTGSGLGAAVATLTAAWWSAEGYEAPFLVTFSQPNLGDSVFTEWLAYSLGDRYLRIVLAKDYLPLFPPARALSALDGSPKGYERHLSRMLSFIGSGMIDSRLGVDLRYERAFWRRMVKGRLWSDLKPQFVREMTLPAQRKKSLQRYLCEYRKAF